MQPRVPTDQLAEARALENLLPSSPDIIEKGKALYRGKGTCFHCHGVSGRGDGVAAVGLEPCFAEDRGCRAPMGPRHEREHRGPGGHRP